MLGIMTRNTLKNKVLCDLGLFKDLIGTYKIKDQIFLEKWVITNLKNSAVIIVTETWGFNILK